MKACKACGETKPITEFSKDRTKPDGLNFYCRPCHKRRQAEFLLRPSKNSAVDGMKRCMRCKETKPVSDFGGSTKTFDLLDRRCKTCSNFLSTNWRKNNMERSAEYMREYRSENLERMKEIDRKKSYGVPNGWYAATLAAQNGECAICRTDTPGGRGAFHVDHCHGSGKVRGLLCHSCNLMLGHAEDRVDILEAAKAYIIQHS